jgi:hypothetical protein
MVVEVLGMEYYRELKLKESGFLGIGLNWEGFIKHDMMQNMCGFFVVYKVYGYFIE